MRLAPEGLPFIAIAVILAALLWWLHPVAGGAAAVVAIWVAAFFRDPRRDGPRGDDLVIAPADGKVVSIIELDEPSVIGGAAVRVSIFMNIFNVHVNRYPVNGRVEHRRHSQGAFFNAATEKAAAENEQSDVGLASPRGRVLVRQIAGLVARRIVTDHEEGHQAVQGERMGLIRFGSRVDVFLPRGTEVAVELGEHTRAGSTVLGRWR